MSYCIRWTFFDTAFGRTNLELNTKMLGKVQKSLKVTTPNLKIIIIYQREDGEKKDLAFTPIL